MPNNIFEVKLKRVELLNFENCAECVIYLDDRTEWYYFQFIKPGTDLVDDLNPKLQGPFNSPYDAKFYASKYYQNEFILF